MDYNALREKYMKDPEFVKAYRKANPEIEICLPIYSNRIKNNMTQQQLADATGIDRADISKLERGYSNPTVSTLLKIAKALGKELVIKFE